MKPEMLTGNGLFTKDAGLFPDVYERQLILKSRLQQLAAAALAGVHAAAAARGVTLSRLLSPAWLPSRMEDPCPRMVPVS